MWITKYLIYELITSDCHDVIDVHWLWSIVLYWFRRLADVDADVYYLLLTSILLGLYIRCCCNVYLLLMGLPLALYVL